ncbi:MAG: fucose 4-O-acetylase-like acetyltransferase [Glaciecola sp.]|jgi:fucose 4-O-acetylase-like acetyltransferase
MTNDRTDWVDYTKGIGIILVVYGHVARGVFNAGIPMPEPAYLLIDSVIYSFHMPLFFFLSGLFFFQSLNRRGNKAVIFSKFDTILYPYLLWSLLQGSIEVILSSFTNGNVSWYEVLQLLWEPRAQFWFLYALFFVFIVATIIYATRAKNYSELVLLVAALLYLYPIILPSYYIPFAVSQYLVYFCAGIVFMKHANMNRFSNLKILLITFIIFVFAQWLFHGYFSFNYTNKGLGTLLLAFVSIAFVISLSGVLATKSLKWLAFIGAMSMQIYLIHVLVGSAARVMLNTLFNIQSYSIHLVIGCIVAIFGSLIAVQIVDKFKIPYLFSAPISVWVTSRLKKESNNPS